MIHECICSTVCGLGKGMVCFSTDNGENPKMGQGGLPHRKMCPSQVLFFSPSFVLSAYKLRCSDSPKESILWKIDGNGNTWAPLERTLVPDPSLDGNGSTWICSLRANFQHHQPLQKCSSQPPLPGFPLRHSVEIKISRKRQGHLEAPQVYAIALGLCGTPWDSVGLRGTIVWQRPGFYHFWTGFTPRDQPASVQRLCRYISYTKNPRVLTILTSSVNV